MTLELRDLIAPMTPEVFIAEWWQRKPFVVHVGREKLGGLLDAATFLRAIGVAAPTNRIVLKAGGQDARGDHVELAINSRDVPSLLALGMTIQAMKFESVHEPARVLLDDARRTLGVAAPMDVGAFLSPDGSGYGLHYDGTSMWAMQLEGEKIWRYGRAPVAPFAQRNRVATATERAAIAPGELIEQRLTPGDVLYLPPGTWHGARAVGRSLHASLTIRPASVLELVDEALSPLLDDVRWRRIPLGDEGAVAVELAARLVELRAQVESLTPAALVAAWRLRGDGSGAVGPIRPAEALVVVADIQTAIDVSPDGDDALALSSGGVRVATLPGHAARFIDALRAAKRFRAVDAIAWDADYPWEDVELVLRSLVELGLLIREPA